jgi:rhodanese-related sulfurtransferase
MSSTTAMMMQTTTKAVVVSSVNKSAKRAQSVRTKALATPYRYPEQGFTDEVVEEVIAAFPDKGIASNLEGMILFAADGYDVLDVRSEAEIEFVGNFPTARKNKEVGVRFHCIPLINAVRKYDSEVGAKVYVQSKNESFKEKIEQTFPDKEAKIIITCSDSRDRAIQALELLDEWGYVNIVGLKGGYNMWNRQWDQNMRRRNLPGNFKEEFSHGAEGMGVHGTGASFQNQDAFQYADWKDSTKWMEWTSGTIPADE